MSCPAPLVLALAHAELIALKRARDWHIDCRQGALSLSGPPPIGDVTLVAGQRYRVPNGALVLLEAWRGAEIALHAPPPAWHRPGRGRWLRLAACRTALRGA